LAALRPAEAGARLYVNALNALAHPRSGLDAVARLAERVPCYAITSGALDATCAAICSAAQNAIAPPADQRV
jgi:hypothetical protein